MENKTLWSKKFEDKKIDLVTVETESVTLTFGADDKITFSTYHDQDCCEHVYGDFSGIKYHSDELTGKSVVEIEIKAVADMGFLLCVKYGYDSYIKIFVPCYNYQNGYYSSALTLKVTEGATTTEIDISSLVEDHTD